MKAMTWGDYHALDQIKIIDIEVPTPKPNQVLLRTHASSINSWDCEVIIDTYLINRVNHFLTGKFTILGADVAGVVEAIGDKVSRFKVGDQVYGDISSQRWGGFAEYVAVDENNLYLKPSNLSFIQAAAVPQSGILALQGIRDYGRLQQGEKVLINGASGGTGTFALQLAKHIGAEVTAACRGSKIDLVQSLGADHVIDYTREDFTQSGEQYDLILDIQAHHPFKDYEQALKPGGRYVIVGGDNAVVNRVIWQRLMTKLFGGPDMRLLLHKANRGLGDLGELLKQGVVEPVIDRVYPLDEIRQAMGYYAEGGARGKVVVTIA